DFKEQQVKFINEALTVKGFRHPHIVKVYEVIQEGELFAVLMEYIKGIPLSKYIEENGQLTEVLALKYIDQISQALECVHKDNYLHRDIKPDNILLRNNYKDTVLIDFGLARIIATQSMTNSLTHGYAPVDIFATKFARTGKKNSSDYEVVKEILTEFELIVDSYEQPIDRPGEYQEQKKYVLAPVLWTINRKVPV
ncbi:protein kinase domain-containing protein, partial [Cylindrospermopsis raciborskii]